MRRDSNNANPPGIIFAKSRGSLGGNTVVQDNDKIGELNFAAADGTDVTTLAAQIKAEVDGTPGSNDMPGRIVLATTADGASSPTERVRIDSSGRVGIGTGAPESYSSYANNLVVNESGNAGISISSTDSGSNVSSIQFTGGTTRRHYIECTNGSNGNFTFQTEGTGAFRFIDGSGERARIDGSGRLGVGTASPTRDLEVSRAGNAFIRAVNSTNSVNIDILAGSSAAFVGPQSNHPLAFQTNNTEVARLDTAGRLLVGTTVAYGSNDNIAIQKTNAAARIGLQHSTTGEVTAGDELGILTFYSNDGDLNPSATITGVADLAHGAGDKPGRLIFSTTADGATSPTERVRIDSSGHITPGANGTQDLGSTSKRFANLYTSDLDLSNEAKGGNDVDGTWGAYTIQEGEEDLFLINKRSGKKYKFMLQEVS